MVRESMEEAWEGSRFQELALLDANDGRWAAEACVRYTGQFGWLYWDNEDGLSLYEANPFEEASPDASTSRPRIVLAVVGPDGDPVPLGPTNNIDPV